MKENQESEARLQSYLLGELSEAEQQRVEEGYFNSEETFDLLLVAEDELIDAYVRGELSEAQRQRFESHFLQTPERRERLLFAETWRQWRRSAPPLPKAQPSTEPLAVAPATAKPAPLTPAPTRWRSAVVALPLAATVLLLLGVTFLFLQNSTLRGERQQAQAERAELQQRLQELTEQTAAERQRADELARELAAERSLRQAKTTPDAPDSASQETVLLALNADATRATGAENRLVLLLRGETRLVSLRFSFRNADYPTYEAVIRTWEGGEVWRAANVPVRGGIVKSVLLTLAAELFRAGRYRLLFSGQTADGERQTIEEFTFTVVR